jgi:hypothetical protein
MRGEILLLKLIVEPLRALYLKWRVSREAPMVGSDHLQCSFS